MQNRSTLFMNLLHEAQHAAPYVIFSCPGRAAQRLTDALAQRGVLTDGAAGKGHVFRQKPEASRRLCIGIGEGCIIGPQHLRRRPAEDVPQIPGLPGFLRVFQILPYRAGCRLLPGNIANGCAQRLPAPPYDGLPAGRKRYADTCRVSARGDFPSADSQALVDAHRCRTTAI